MYSIPSELQLKEAIVFVCRDFLTAGSLSGRDRETTKVVKTYEKDGHDVKSEERVDIPEIVKYFIFSEIPEQ